MYNKKNLVAIVAQRERFYNVDPDGKIDWTSQKPPPSIKVCIKVPKNIHLGVIAHGNE